MRTCRALNNARLAHPLALVRPAAAIQAVDPLSRLLLSPADLATTKLALAGFASAYPFLFRYACVQLAPRPDPKLTRVATFRRSQSGDQNGWARVVQLKMAVLQLWRTGSTGAKVGAVKVLQRIVQTQSTAATADPRVRFARRLPACTVF